MEIAVLLLAGLLLIAFVAWVVKLMLKPVVIFTIVALLGWMLWASGLGQGGNTPDPELFQQQIKRSIEDN